MLDLISKYPQLERPTNVLNELKKVGFNKGERGLGERNE